MSWEGYYVYYCINGHRLGTQDAYARTWLDSVEEAVCPFCGVKEKVFDLVDLTDGCFCEELKNGEKCPAHEIELRPLGYDPVFCEKCAATGNITVQTDWRNESCECQGENLFCEECHGTGTKRVVEGEHVVHCPKCKGTGTYYIERYDISPLKR